MNEAINAFLLGFPALFSIINPISGALIFHQVTTGRSPRNQAHLARLIGLYALLVMLVALSVGSYVLAFFGITLAALRIAGGLVVALTGWNLLNTPETGETRKQEEAGAPVPSDDIALFPMTIPITAGPGTISVAVALGAEHPTGWPPIGWFFLGMTGAAVAMALMIWALYSFAERLTALMGRAGNHTVTRLAAFLLLCIGVQILITGVQDVLGPMLAARQAG
jgi:multiple antibiotic resistance protein